MIDYVWLVPLFPAIGFILNGLFGHRAPKGLVGFVGSAAVGLSFLISLMILFDLTKLPPADRHFDVIIYTWMLSGPLDVPIGFLVDPLSVVMMMVVTGVGCLIHIYSVGYMHDEKGFFKFFTYLNLFVFSMLLLVTANNFLLMFVGWEGVGFCSYVLIGFYHEKKEATDAGNKAFWVNRIGDFGFLLGIMLIFVTFGSLGFSQVFEMAPGTLQMGGLIATMITLLLFVGAAGKSAQLPIYVWLPDAMEGPTPVSALIHAATMVTAGVYMVVRCSALFVLAPVSMWVVATVGVLTAIFAASIGLTQFDIKRVLAYSTISQLGYMFLAAGVGAFSTAIFHLMTHAFFKALLFLGAGSVMHALGGELDMRKMGNLRKIMPHTYITYLIATLAIAGIFPFAGFFSKDEILYKAFSAGGGGKLLWIVGAAAAFMTAFYMFRTVYMTFHGESRMDPHVESHAHESPKIMTVPLMILALLSIVGGFVGIPLIEGGNQIGQFLAPSIHEGSIQHSTAQGLAYAAGGAATNGTGGHSVFGEIVLMLISLGIAIGGWMFARKMYVLEPSLPGRVASGFKGFYTLVFNKYLVDELYDAIVVRPLKRFSNWLWHSIDDSFIDWLVNYLAEIIQGASGLLRKIQSGFVQNYAMAILIGILFIFGYLVFYA